MHRPIRIAHREDKRGKKEVYRSVEKMEFFDRIEAEAIRMGGGVKRGVISQAELEAAQEIRVSIRPTNHIGSTELFTLRKLKPGAYHLMLVAIPRRR